MCLNLLSLSLFNLPSSSINVNSSSLNRVGQLLKCLEFVGDVHQNTNMLVQHFFLHQGKEIYPFQLLHL